AERVAEARERDAPGRLQLLDEHLPRLLVGAGRDREAVADADEPSLLLEEPREGAIRDLHRFGPEPRLDLRDLLLAPREAAGGARPVELGAAQLEPEPG